MAYVHVNGKVHHINTGATMQKWAVRGAGLFAAVASYNFATKVAAILLGVKRR